MAEVNTSSIDRLLVPRLTQEVTVVGEVQSATSHLYRAELSRGDYIAMSGGLTPRANDDRIYVVRADGSVATRGNTWFSGGVDIRTGDTKWSRLMGTGIQWNNHYAAIYA